jgi:PKD repeat protein
VADRIVLSATPAAGNTATLLATVFDTVGNALPGALVTFTTSSGTVASSVVRTNSLGQAPNLLFGTSDAVVTAETAGLRASVAVRIDVGGTLSVNVALSPANPVRRQNVVFTATATMSGNIPAIVQRYEWLFSDGVVVTTTGNQTIRAFEAEGIYSVTVRVFTADGTVGTSRVEFYVD